MGGQVPLLIDAIVPSGTQVAAGSVRTSPSCRRSARSRGQPGDANRAGLAGFDAAPLYGVLGPAGMDAVFAQKLNSTLVKAWSRWRCARSRGNGFDVVGSTPDAYAG